jgi:hypothetical protein
MLKRKIYLLLTIILQFSLFLFCYKFPIANELTIGSFIATFVLSTVILALAQMLFGLILTITESIDQPTDIITPNVGFLTFKFKRIYYSELGYFWTLKIKDKIYVYKQGYFYLSLLFYVNIDDNINKTMNDIKTELDYIFREEIKIKKINDVYKDWNGFLDTQSERDGKLNDIGVK